MNQDPTKELQGYNFQSSETSGKIIIQSSSTSLGKRGRATKLISQDNSSCDDLTQLESISPNQFMFTRLTPVIAPHHHPSPVILKMSGISKKDNCWGWFVDAE